MIRRAGTAVALGVVVAFLAVPVIALFVQAPLSDLPSLLRRPEVRDAIWVTVKTNVAANILLLLFGTPAAWVLATRRFPGRAAILTLCELPLVLPPAVAGIALLAAYAQGGLFGDALDAVGVVLPFGPWAVILAITFVASPFYLRQAVATFSEVDGDLTDVARTLGASPTGRSGASSCRWPPAAWSPDGSWPSRAVSASSAPRSSSPATCRGAPRR